MNTFSFTVMGPPVPLARTRTVRTTSGKHVTFTPKRSGKYEECVRNHAMAARGRNWTTAGAFAVWIHAYFQDGRVRDADNLAKAVLDAMNKVIYRDDSQVSELHVYKRVDHERPRVEITIERRGEEVPP